MNYNIYTDGDANQEGNNEVTSFCYNGSWYTVNSTETIVCEQSGTSQINDLVVVLGALLAVAMILLIGITTALCVYTCRIKYKKGNHDATLSRE